ncbi:MAG: DUF4268 domain-containing protein [Acidimicrobiales bacterium]
MTHAFISYSSLDQGMADRVVEGLEARGARCWISSRDVPHGARYAAALVEAVEEAEALVFLLTEHSAGSVHCARELELAMNARVQVIPVRVDDCAVPAELRYYFAGLQWLASQPDGEAWVEQLARALPPGVVGPPPAPVEPVPVPPTRAPRQARSDLYRAFWGEYLEQVRAAHPEWTKTRVVPDKNWMTQPSPIPGTMIMPIFRKGGSIGHDLAIDSGDATRNTEIFQRLLAAKPQIEAAYGAALEWLELPNRHECRIQDTERGSVTEVTGHPRLIGWLIDRGERLRAALEAFLEQEGRAMEAAPEAPAAKAATARFEELLSAGTDEARALDELLRGWCSSPGASYLTGKSSRSVVVDGCTLARLYPQWDVLALDLKPLIKEGRGDDADAVRALLTAVEPGSRGGAEPNLRCATGVEHWDFVATELLPALAEMRTRGTEAAATPPAAVAPAEPADGEAEPRRRLTLDEIVERARALDLDEQLQLILDACEGVGLALRPMTHGVMVAPPSHFGRYLFWVKLLDRRQPQLRFHMGDEGIEEFFAIEPAELHGALGTNRAIESVDEAREVAAAIEALFRGRPEVPAAERRTRA